MWKYVGGIQTILGTAASSPATPSGTAVAMGLDFSGSTITGWGDGIARLTIEDEAHSSGYAGFRMNSQAGIYVDDFTITGPPVPAMGASVFGDQGLIH